jgi:ribokinase
MTEIVVIGSLNMDLSVHVPRIPRPGETISGGDIVTSAGGKGANQAAACARLGAKVAMVGSVGRDDFGNKMKSSLSKFGVEVTHVSELEGVASGSAIILVEEKGENCIVISGGANQKYSLEFTSDFSKLIKQAKLVLLQLEIDLGVVYQVIEIAHAAGVPVILNPAPAAVLKPEIYTMIDYLIPNETEIALLTGVEVIDDVTAKTAADSLLVRGVKNVIVTLGSNGAYVANSTAHYHVDSQKVKAVDTTAAGDAFIGGFACALIRNFSLKEAVRFACCTGALATTRFGAQTSLPSLPEVTALYGQEGGELK